LPELAAIGGNFTKLDSCFAGFAAADAGQRPMAKDHIDGRIVSASQEVQSSYPETA
jgi:hypothetical protein